MNPPKLPVQGINTINQAGPASLCTLRFYALGQKALPCRYPATREPCEAHHRRGCGSDTLGESAEQEIVSPKDNRSYHVSHSPIFHEDGSISKMTIYRDITDSKKAEKKLVETKIFLDNILLYSGGDAVIATDMDMRKA